MFLLQLEAKTGHFALKKSSLESIEESMRDLFRKTLEVAAAVEDYAKTPGHSEEDYTTLSAFILRQVKEVSALDVMEMLQFFQQLSPAFLAAAEMRSGSWDTSDLDLEKELHAIYRKAKATLDSDADSAALQMCIKALDTLVKLRERVRDQERVQQVEDTLLKLLDEADPLLRDKFLERLQATCQTH